MYGIYTLEEVSKLTAISSFSICNLFGFWILPLGTQLLADLELGIHQLNVLPCITCHMNIRTDMTPFLDNKQNKL